MPRIAGQRPCGLGTSKIRTETRVAGGSRMGKTKKNKKQKKLKKLEKIEDHTKNFNRLN